MRVTVYKNGIRVGTLTIDAHSAITKSGDVPGSVESDIVVALFRDNVGFGTAMVGPDKYEWQEEVPDDPSAKPPVSWWERVRKAFEQRN